MGKTKRLTKRQLDVIDDLFAAGFDEQAVLDKHNISRNVYKKWQADDSFAAEFNRRLAWLNLQSEALVARYASLAAAKLVGLTESQNPETARKACLDILSLPKLTAQKTQRAGATQTAAGPDSLQLPEETASKILAVLADEKKEPD